MKTVPKEKEKIKNNYAPSNMPSLNEALGESQFKEQYYKEICLREH